MKKFFLIAALFFLSASCNIFGNSGVLGVLKTLDGGVTWKASDTIAGSNNNISALAISEMTFDPTNTQNVFLSAENEGLWSSTDGGQSWKQLLSKIDSYDFYLNPTNSKSIYVVGLYSTHGKIIMSQDGGASWREIYNEASVNNAVTSISVNPQNPKEMYASLASGVFIKSVDGGTNWFVSYDFKDFALKLRYNPLNSMLYALLRTKGLAESADGGKTWTTLTSSLTGSSTFDVISLSESGINSFTKMALDDQTAGVIYLSTSKGLYKTTDDGKNWLFVNIPVRNSSQLPRAIASTKGGMLAYTSIGNTLYKTSDGAQSWQTQEIPTTNLVSKILIDPSHNNNVFVGLVAQ